MNLVITATATLRRERRSTADAHCNVDRGADMAHSEQIFRDLLKTIAAEHNLPDHDPKIQPISTDGANYTSKLYSATLSNGEKELNLFAKVAAIGDKLRSQFPMQIYDVERLFYTKLTKIFNQLEEEAAFPEAEKFRTPIFYGYNSKLNEETIVLENLVSNGFSSFNRFESVTWEDAASAVKQLAKFHALSVVYEESDPEGYAEDLKVLTFCQNKNSEITSFWDNLVQKAVDAIREENKDRTKKYFEKHFNEPTEAFEKLLSPGKLSVICHGDYRPSNMMRKELQDGTVEVIPVDFQTLRGGGPVVDLYYFIFTGTDKQFRDLHYRRLIDLYYSELCAALVRLGLNPEEKYPREDYDAELIEKLPFGLGVAVFSLPIVTVAAENAPKVDENMDITSFSIQKTSSLYPERINGIVDDFIRWGVL